VSPNCVREYQTSQLKVTGAQKVKAGIIAAAVLVGVIAGVLLMTHRSQTRFLSLVFERYSSDLDFYVHDVAFLWLTNSSDRTYVLPMAGGKDTFERDTVAGNYSGSYMFICVFSDQANPMPQDSFAGWSKCLPLAPHSAVRLRVALPPEGQKRRVAVLCAETPSGRPRMFWTKGIGLSILRMLPRSVGRKLLFSQPAVLRIWCDRELLPAGEIRSASGGRS
jgi:hypothetical protein